MHVGGVYDHWTAEHPDVRLFILTRSGFGGIQRYGATIWSGDIAARWSDMRDQISAGVNFSMSGVPNWSFDIGGYTMEERFAHPDAAALAEWRELYTRWFQFGAFVPIFRAHGELVKREIYNIAPEGSEVYETLAAYDRLRYRLMPYIYTLAGDLYHRDSTMMRALAMDFPADRRAWNVDDEYMFGSAFLVAPVTEYKARTRRVYLPAGARWYDFYTCAVYQGGREITAAAPLSRMPLFVRAGSIVPIGWNAQYTGEEHPITLYVYEGASGRFDLYQDDGLTRAYERGEYSRVPIAYDDAKGMLTIGARSGHYQGMVEKPIFYVRWISGRGNPGGLDFAAAPDSAVHYTGKAVTLRRPGPHR
jgi:alpha-D-xyloside xylohydrolase